MTIWLRCLLGALLLVGGCGRTDSNAGERQVQNRSGAGDLLVAVARGKTVRRADLIDRFGEPDYAFEYEGGTALLFLYNEFAERDWGIIAYVTSDGVVSHMGINEASVLLSNGNFHKKAVEPSVERR